jgi:hypothetical protein
VILGLAIAIVALTCLFPYELCIDRHYPQLAADAQPLLTLAPIADKTKGGSDMADTGKLRWIQIPFEVSGMSEDAILTVDGVKFWIEGPDGLRWNSDWQSLGVRIFPEEDSLSVGFRIKRELFDRFKDSQTRLRVSLAITVYRDSDRRNFVIPPGTFQLLDGTCSTNGYGPILACRTPLKGPRFLLITSDEATSYCETPHIKEGILIRKRARAFEVDESSFGLADFGINPVHTFYLSTNRGGSNYSGLCPGAPVVLSEPVREKSVREDFDLGNLRLSDYQMHNGSVVFQSR